MADHDGGRWRTDEARRRSSISIAAKLASLVVANVAAAIGSVRFGMFLGWPNGRAELLGLGVGIAAGAISSFVFWVPLRRKVRAVNDGISSFREGDFSLRLVATRSDEIGELVHLYNGMADAMRSERSHIYERELLLDTLLQRAPMAIVLMSPQGRVLYANGTAKRFFGGHLRPGRVVEEASKNLAPELQEILARGDDGLVTVPKRESADEEVYRVVRRDVDLGTIRHRLLVIERVTFELRRQEIETWKKVIRILCHELNNSLAPVSSLIHSARHVANVPEHRHKQDEILATVDERVQHLVRFLEGYARFARLPRPRPQAVEISSFLERLRGMFPFGVEGRIEGIIGYFDPGHMEQVMINLLKNAHESESPPEGVKIAIIELPTGELSISVSDRGHGMSEDALARAMLPFSSSKPGGSGVGLALCNEVVSAHGGRISIRSRSGEGTTVVCFLPAGPRGITSAKPVYPNN